MTKWANKERGLRFYGKGTDVYGREWHVQDGSWAEFHGIRIYGHDSDNEGSRICISLKKSEVKKMIKALKESYEKEYTVA